MNVNEMNIFVVNGFCSRRERFQTVPYDIKSLDITSKRGLNKMMHERKLNRLKGYDYSTPGAYFITICISNRNNLFGTIENCEMKLNELGKIVNDCWYDLVNHYKNIELDEFVIMPNHVHGIIQIINVGNGFKPFPTKTISTKNQHGLPEIVRGFKTFSSRRINEIKPEMLFRWQKSYYDRIIRNDEELNRIREYIIHNPTNLDIDIDNELYIGNDLISDDKEND